MPQDAKKDVKESSKIVCIMGMERGGTSLLTRLLNAMGVDLGPEENLIIETDYNPKGCWEQRNLLHLNETMLQRLGGDTHDLPQFPSGWERSADFADLRAEAQTIIHEQFDSQALWGWKDTRNSLTLPFWQNLLPDLYHVICVRNPLDVAASMLSVGWVETQEKAIELWLDYLTSAMAHTTGKKRLFVIFENLMQDWTTEADRLCAFLEIPKSSAKRKAKRVFETYIDKSLHHHDTGFLNMVDAPDLPYPAKALYTILRLYASVDTDIIESGLGGAATLEQSLDGFGIHSTSHHLLVEQLKRTLTSTQEALESREGEVLDLHEELDGKRQDLRKAHARLSERVTQIENLHSMIQEREESIHDYLAHLGEAEALFTALQSEFDAKHSQVGSLQVRFNKQAARIEALQENLEEKLARLDASRAALAATQKELGKFRKELAAEEENVRTLSEALEHRTKALKRQKYEARHRIRSIEKNLKTKTDFIEELQQSLAWNTVLRLRAILDRLVPIGSRRRRMYSKVVLGFKTVREHGWRGFLRGVGRRFRREPVSVAVDAEASVEVSSVGPQPVAEVEESSPETPKKKLSLEDIAVCTVASKNYLGFIRTFCKSVQKVHPGIKIYTLLVDRLDGKIHPDEEPFDLVRIDELRSIPNASHMFFKYHALELNTAIKPYFFEYLFQREPIKKLIYFDPDIVVFQSLDEIFDVLDFATLAITPHILEPIRDDRHPSELDLLRAGTFNLGFLGMARSVTTSNFLKWWQERLYDYGASDPDQGLFVDQKWVNFAPALFDGVEILRDPLLNIAYWNLHERGGSLRFEQDQLYLNEHPVVFFHFSGFDPTNLEILSRHQDRFTLDHLPNLRRLFSYYRRKLRANGQFEVASWPYAFDYFDNGVRIPKLARKMYRLLGKRALRFGDPFATVGPQAFLDWLNDSVEHEPDPLQPRITRLQWEIYQTRPDLQQAFPDPLGAQRVLLSRWMRKFGVKEYNLHEVFFPGPADVVDEQPHEPRPVEDRKRFPLRLFPTSQAREAPAAGKDRTRLPGKVSVEAETMGMPSPDSSFVASDITLRTTPSLPFGVNVAGYIHGEFGVAEVARSSAKALEAAGVPYVLNAVLTPIHRHEDKSFEYISPWNPFSVNLVHVNADQTSEFYRQKGWEYFQGRHTIGTWFWELSAFPKKWQSSFRYYQEIWVASTFCQESIARSSPIPVVKMTFPVLVDERSASRDRKKFDLPDESFIFLFHFDFLSVFERKNPIALLEAYRKAFGDRRDRMLVIKSINSEQAPEKYALLREASQGLNVHFIDGHIDRADMLSLMNSCDSFVSLHRSEGLGLGLARSMYLGKPVIATGYSGNMAFMNHNNSFLVRYQLAELDQDYGPYEQGNVWADPDAEHAAELMQAVSEDRDMANSVGQRAAEDIRRTMSAEVAGREMEKRIRQIAGF